MKPRRTGKKLTEKEYRILREKGTEAPFTGKYLHTKDEGVYKCAACGNELFSSETKFDSGTGWPSFTDPMNLENIELKEDRSYSMVRTAVSCKECGSHLGHVFDYDPKNGKGYYCINSVCLDLTKDLSPLQQVQGRPEQDRGATSSG